MIQEMDSVFDDEMGLDLDANSTIFSGKIQADADSARHILLKEMEGISPAMRTQISDKIQNSNIDRNKFRDLFLIKKRIVNDGEREIVSFDIKERIVPRTPSISLLTADFYTRIFFMIIILILCSLVITTTVRMYKNLIKLNYTKNVPKNTDVYI